MAYHIRYIISISIIIILLALFSVPLLIFFTLGCNRNKRKTKRYFYKKGYNLLFTKFDHSPEINGLDKINNEAINISLVIYREYVQSFPVEARNQTRYMNLPKLSAIGKMRY